MLKKTIAALVVAALSGCGTAPLGNTGTANIKVTFTERNANVTSSNGVSCNTPCALNYKVDLSKDMLVNDNVTYMWPSGTTQAMHVVVRRGDVNQFGTELTFALPPNINTAERLTTNRAPAAQSSGGSALNELAKIWNEAADERKRNAPVRRSTPVHCSTILMGDLASTTCQ